MIYDHKRKGLKLSDIRNVREQQKSGNANYEVAKETT